MRAQQDQGPCRPRRGRDRRPDRLTWTKGRDARSGRQYRQCCASKRYKFVYKDGLLHKVTPVGRDVLEALEHVRRAFMDKFGREHRVGEPLFFDPDADTPRLIDFEKFRRAVVASMKEVGVDPAHIYAFEQTGTS